MRHPKSIEEFIGTFRGRLIQREDPEYDEARSIYNAMIDKRPLLIAQCADVADVMACVNFARDAGLDLAVRGGGHNGAGLALVDDGIVVDLSRMKGIRVDPEAKSVRVEPGCRWQDVDHATHAFGLATVSGIIANTGVGGLTLGGGHGYLTRKYGLTIDNLLSADVVLADGTLVHANDNDNADLFWALRGGGGNFGIVTSFEYRLHPVENVVGGPVLWSLDDLETTMRWYRDWLPSAPDDVYAYYLVMEVPPVDHFPDSLHGRKVCGMFVCYTGPADRSEEVLAPIREVAAPVAELVHEMPYPVLQSMLDGLYPPGLQWYWKGDFVREISDEAVTQHRRFAEVPTPHSTMHLYPVDGAAHRSASDATAWGHRDATWSMVIAGVDPRPSKNDAIESWATDYWNALHPYSLGAAYINFMMEEGQERVRAFYGDNYEQLRRIKTKYDPGNFFHVNQNVKPLC